jgi:exonuclease VII small subunit
MTVAFQTVELALRGLPGDASLVEASAKLKSKAEQFAAELEAHQPALDAATAIVRGCDQKLAAAKQAVEPIVADQAVRAQGVTSAGRAKDQAVAKAQTDRLAVDEEVRRLAESWVADFTIAALKPLSAEQICWSVLRVSGIEDRYRAGVKAELDKASPLTEEAAKDSAHMAAREREIEQKTYEKLKGTTQEFVNVFAAAAGQPQNDFFATADQALFVANGGSIHQWIAPASGNVTERMVQEVDLRRAAEDLYQTVFSRPPSEAEATEVASRLAAKPMEKPAVARELVWSLVTSAEFRFNH